MDRGWLSLRIIICIYNLIGVLTLGSNLPHFLRKVPFLLFLTGQPMIVTNTQNNIQISERRVPRHNPNKSRRDTFDMQSRIPLTDWPNPVLTAIRC